MKLIYAILMLPVVIVLTAVVALFGLFTLKFRHAAHDIIDLWGMFLDLIRNAPVGFDHLYERAFYLLMKLPTGTAAVLVMAICSLLAGLLYIIFGVILNPATWL